jgi:hypothetical protein
VTAAYMRRRRADALSESIMLRADIYPPRPGWQQQRGCTGVNPDVFFQTDSQHPRRICAACPVRIDCASDCVQTENRMGIPTDLIFGYRGVSATMRRDHRTEAATRPRAQGYPKQDVNDIACRAHTAGLRMAAAVAEHFDISERAATGLIYRVRQAGWPIPYDRQPPNRQDAAA